MPKPQKPHPDPPLKGEGERRWTLRPFGVAFFTPQKTSTSGAKPPNKAQLKPAALPPNSKKSPIFLAYLKKKQ